MRTARRRADWFKSSYSSQQNGCVEVRFDADAVLVRDSKHPAAGQFAVPSAHWTALLAHVRH